MREGKYKTNTKPIYWECNNCNYRDPYYYFEKGILWWKKVECPQCGSTHIGLASKPKVAPPPQMKKK